MNAEQAGADFGHDLVHEWIYLRLDDALPAQSRLHLEQHLEHCAECRAFARQVNLLDRRLRADLPMVGADSHMQGRLPAVDGAWLEQEWQRRARSQQRLRTAGLWIGLLLAVIGLVGYLSRPGNRPQATPPPSFVDLNNTQTAVAAWPTATLAATQTPRPTPQPRSPGRLLFEASDNRSTDLYISRADASGAVLLGPHSNSERAPHISPDGQRVAFLSNRLNFGDYEIYLINIDGSAAHLLTEMEPASYGWTGEMTWSPDSRQLLAVFVPDDPAPVFLVKRGDPVDQSRDYDGHWEGQIYTLDAESGASALLTPPDWVTWNPTWSPDGSRVYFSALREGYARLFSIRPDGTDLQAVGPTDNLMEQTGFTFSPDGNYLAILNLRRTRGNARSDEVQLLHLPSGSSRTLWQMPNSADLDFSLAVRYASLRWSPDGQRLMYAIPRPDGTALLKMLTMAANPGAPAELRATAETVLFVGIDLYFPGHVPAWSLDSRSLAILLQRQVYIVSANADADVQGSADLLEIYTGKRDEIGAGWINWIP